MKRREFLKRTIYSIPLLSAIRVSAQAGPHFYLAPWVWNTSMGAAFWDRPQSTIPGSAMDLRSITAQSQAGTGTGFGLFCYLNQQVTIQNSVYLGQDPTSQIRNPDKNAIQNRLGITLSGTTLRDLIWDLLTLKADPDGLARCRPLMPTSKRSMEMFLNNSPIRQEVFNPSEHSFVVAMLQRNYREVYKLVEAGKAPEDLHRKFLGAMALKFRGIEVARMIPPDLPRERPAIPTTTLSDNFDRTDAADMSTSAPFSWTDLSGDWQIVSNQASQATDNSTRHMARAESDLSSDDHFCQGDIIKIGTSYPSLNAVTAGVAARFASAASTCYYVQLINHSPSSNPSRTTKRVTGTDTTLGTDDAQTFSTPDTLKIEVDGSSIKRYFNGSLEDTTTDTAITGNTRCGLESYIDSGQVGHDAKIDNWSAEDLVAAEDPTVIQTILM